MNELGAFYAQKYAIERERAVREGTIKPATAAERRQAKQGPRPTAEYDACKPKRNKFNARSVVVDGQKFDSQAEARRWGELRLLERAGEIHDLQRQRVYRMVVNGIEICRIIPDFDYLDKDGAPVTEDVKSKPTLTPVFRVKAKLFYALFRRDIKLIGV